MFGGLKGLTTVTHVLVDGIVVDKSVAEHLAAGVQFVCSLFQFCSLCCLFLLTHVAVDVNML